MEYLPCENLALAALPYRPFKLNVRVFYWWQVYLSEQPVVLATALMVEEATLLTGIVPDAHLSTCAREPR
jgi:hypothetical protein